MAALLPSILLSPAKNAAAAVVVAAATVAAAVAVDAAAITRAAAVAAADAIATNSILPTKRGLAQPNPRFFIVRAPFFHLPLIFVGDGPPPVVENWPWR